MSNQVSGDGVLIAWESRPPRFPNAVVMATDALGLPHACFLAEQILEKETTRDFDVVICVFEHELIPQALLDLDIRFCQVDPSGELEGIPSTSMIPLAAYLRLLMPQVFVKDYQRMLYIDTDVYLRRPGLGAAFTSEISGPVALAPDVQAFGTDEWIAERKVADYIAGLELPPTHIYRNSGVMLLDLSRMAERGDGEKIMAYARRMGAKLRHHDQSAINGAIGEEISLMSIRWNLPQFPGLQERAEDLDALLLHFTSWPKPWDAIADTYRNQFRDEYQSYFTHRFPGYQEAWEKAYGPSLMERLRPWLANPRQAWRAVKRQRHVPYRRLDVFFHANEERFAELLDRSEIK